MRVLIDTTYVGRGRSGTGVYVERLIEALRETGVEIVEATNAGRGAPAGGGVGSVQNAISDRTWVRSELPRLAREAGADVVHHPLPAFSRGCDVPQVVTVHDLAFVERAEDFNRVFAFWARRAHRTAAHRAGVVVVPSETTAASLRHHWGVDGRRVVVAHHGSGQRLGVDRAEPPSHFLYIGDDEPRKGLRHLLPAHARYWAQAGPEALPLVLAGRIGELPAQDGVRVEHAPSAEALGRLLERSAALVHLSRHEGFGLTPLEAMAAGVPVIAARTGAVLEVCGNAATFVDPEDSDGVAAAMATLARDGAIRLRADRDGRERADGFSWAASAQAHLHAYTLAGTV